MNSTAPPQRPAWPAFDEELRLAERRRRGLAVYADLERWLAQAPLDPLLRARLTPRILQGEEPGTCDTPAEYALALAESLGAPEADRVALGRCAALFWAAADTSDDVDDRDVSGGLRGGEAEGAPTANDACALLFLAQRALAAWRRDAADDAAAYGLRMAGGQARDLASTGRPADPGADGIVRDKAGAELALFFRWAALAAGRDPGPYEALGEVFGAALQIFSDVADLYLKPVSDDFAAGKWSPPLAAWREGRIGAAADWEALDRTRGDVIARLRWEAAGGVVQSIAGRKAGFVSRWSELRDACPDPGPFDQAAAWLAATLDTVEEAVGALEEPPAPAVATVERAARAACAFLESGPFAEEHRWGLFGKDYVAGTVFAAIFQAAALRLIGGRWAPALERLVALRDADGWRYYPGHAEIPPDADDAGLILGHFGDAIAPALVEATVRQLAAHFEADRIHTWMGAPAGDVHWEGDDCLATLANASWGLLRTGHARVPPRGAWQRLAAAAAGGDFESPFYTREPTRFFVHRALAAAVTHGVLRLDEVAPARRRLEAELAASRRLGGAHEGDVLANACAGLATAAWGEAPDAPSLTWLCERQQIDGAWPEAPCFRTPGPGMRPFYWGHRGVTTAFAAMLLGYRPAVA